MRTRARDRTLLKQEAILGLTDPWYFSTEILGNGKNDPNPRPEREMRPQLEFHCRPRPKGLLPDDKWFDYWSGPRETGKTVNALVALTREIIRNPNIAILIMNEEKQQAVQSLKMIAEWLTRSKVEQLYGKFRGTTSWEKEAITVSQRSVTRKDPTVQATGINLPIEGWHPDWVLFDDLIGRDTATREGFKRASDRIDQTIPVIRTGGRATYICTRYGLEDPSSGILAKWGENLMWHAAPPRGFFGAYAVKGDETVFPHAVVGEPLFPSILPRARLLELQRTIPWSWFSSQYLNEPAPEGGAYFDASDVQYFDLYVTAVAG